MAREWAHQLNARNVAQVNPGIGQPYPTSLGNVWIGETKPSAEQLAAAQDWARQSVFCDHCGHAARYHANKGLDPKGKCDPWYTSEPCNCQGFEPVASRQFDPSP